MDDELYDAEYASGTPLQKAVLALGERIGVTESEFSTWRMSQIFAEAKEVYGDELPEFWQVWQDWSGPDTTQPMGDL